MRHPLVSISALSALSAVAAPARADHPPIVLESYVGDRPADADAILSPLIEELAKQQFVVGPEVVGRRFEATASRPAVAGGLPPDFAAALARGHDLWMSGKFDAAAAVLGPLIEAARVNTGELARSQHRTLGPQLQKARIALALSQQKLGDRSAAMETLQEALRSDPDLRLSRGMYGQEASELYAEVARRISERGAGKVIVTIDAAGAGIYVNERLVDMGDGAELSLPPGTYRVVARIGDDLSRAHQLGVVAGGVHRLTIDPAFDRALHTGPTWTGFRFASAADRDRDELRYGAALAAAIDARQVIVLGIDTVRGRRMIRGALVNKVNGRDLRTGSIPLDGSPSADQRRNLARFLNGAPATPDIIVGEIAGADDREAAAAPPAAPPWGGWKWVAGGAALAAGIAGGVLLSYDGRCSAEVAAGVPCPSTYGTGAQGWAAIGGAAALAGVAAYFTVTERRARARWTTYVAPTAGGALAGYAGRF